ncbi:hypothetical protein LSAT2_004880 [Lamellibrachia satsuma]|nr:hypothetical protein LSAT2_004880 [Lamellibrachia satsuma]
MRTPSETWRSAAAAAANLLISITVARAVTETPPSLLPSIRQPPPPLLPRSPPSSVRHTREQRPVINPLPARGRADVLAKSVTRPATATKHAS